MADDRVDFNGNAMLVGPSNDGDILRLGDTGAYASGFFAVQFYDAQVDEGPSFTGTIIPVATPRKWDSPESGGNIPFNATQRAFEVPFIPIPYRIVILNGVSWDVTLPNSYVIAGTAITTTCGFVRDPTCPFPRTPSIPDAANAAISAADRPPARP